MRLRNIYKKRDPVRTAEVAANMAVKAGLGSSDRAINPNIGENEATPTNPRPFKTPKIMPRLRAEICSCASARAIVWQLPIAYKVESTIAATNTFCAGSNARAAVNTIATP
ncbi:hypothetical protein AMC82_PC00057 (plasmid) [Rhizobium phaseoli]|uniref:Uncharacterized protein n=1 Tax=Rhizobium phaseoli TaxID=396 RepID=A0ABM6CI22_9HYPH|nr:hypothetical protein AMC84_PC00057 [Rhizobium phaseoli]ANL81430.1 hypothetical protein AMC82_PC00057 [Rhizobium phaseoli]ANL87917.1 hypothetical protein AMC81_PD00060 [Rhizobium phaseoli]ANL94426.1 hypothetical protein AMC80_PD00060 [Rhizobium phaseoli]